MNMITRSEITTYETKEQARPVPAAANQTYLKAKQTYLEAKQAYSVAKEAYIKASLANEPADNDN